jgi:fucose 4-O-acetylase-like acetyltransferase
MKSDDVLETNTLQISKKSLSKNLFLIRGIAILLVVMGHILGPGKNAGIGQLYNYDIFFLSWFGHFIYTFHMPIFFIISGIAFTVFSKKDVSYLKFVQDKFKRLFVPLLCWSPVFFIVQSLSKHEPFSFLDIIKNSTISPSIIFWFFHALIFASLLSFLLFKLFKSHIIYLLLSIILLIVSLKFNNLTTYFYWHLFYALGLLLPYYLHKTHIILDKWGLGVLFAVLSSCIIMMIGVNNFIASNDLWLSKVPNGILAFVFLYIIIYKFKPKPSDKPISKLVNLVEASLVYIGKMSMIIYLTHIYFGTGTRIFLVKFIGVTNPILHFVLGCFIATLGPIIIYKFFQKRSKLFMYSLGESK